ncbi:MAG TPA: FtsX-like permease family protein [Fimbriimonadaceae bacterium]|nr:FtsX-like permease family protein [Fimbriimonadaceae bacterium]
MMRVWATLLALAWRNVWRNRHRTLITLAVVGGGLYSVLVLASLMDAWARSSEETTMIWVTASGQIHAKGYRDNPVAANGMAEPDSRLLSQLESPEVRAWAPRIRVQCIVQSEYRSLPANLWGVEPSREEAISAIPRHIADGRYLEGPDDDGIVLGKRLASRLKTRVGKRVIVLAQAADGSLAQRGYRVVGLFAGNLEVEDSEVETGLAVARRTLHLEGRISEIGYALQAGANLGSVTAGLQSAAPGLEVEPWTKLAPMAVAMGELANGFVWVWLCLTFIFIAIGILNTQLMSVYERLREFGLLLAIGMRPARLVLEVGLEAALLVGIGVAGGLAAAVGTVALFGRGVDLTILAQGAEYLGAGHVLYPSVNLREFLEVAFIVWFLGVAVALIPARRAAKTDPAEVIAHAT